MKAQQPHFKPFWLLPDSPGMLGVCAWCCPEGAENFLARYPMFRGRSLSHGCCPAHLAQLSAEMDQMEQVIAKPTNN